MTREQIRKTIAANLHEKRISPAEIRLQPDPYGGWRLAVVADAFAGMPFSERETIVLKGLEDLDFEWLDLLAPEETEAAGALPLDSALEDLPLWPESLARQPSVRETRRFPSDLEQDLAPPISVSFYSLRGGVGRSTALAYTGWILAAKGRKVVCVDMDLEAPGLAALLDCENEVEEGMGVAQLLVQLDAGGQCDVANHLIRVSSDYDLYCLPAGRPDANHARLLRLIDPAAWYREERNPLRELFENLRSGLPFTPDVLLFDARTGITPLSAPLLFDLADVSVIVLFPHPQARVGTEALVRALLRAESWRSLNGQVLTPEPRFLVSPLPSSRAPEIIERYHNRALEWISKWLTEVNDSRQEGQFLESDITHFVPYREALATSDHVAEDTELRRDFEPVAEWVERFLPTRMEQRAQPSLKQNKAAVLHELRFSAGNAEEQDNLAATFVATDTIQEAMRPATALVLGRKGAGKTAVFRYLAEENDNAVAAQCPPQLRAVSRRGVLGPDGFRSVEEILKRSGADWRQFWAYYTCVAVREQGIGSAPREELGRLLPESFGGELDVVETFNEVVRAPNFALLLNDWLDRLDEDAAPDTFVLYDGLDTGFGSGPQDRERRLLSIAGLFDFWLDRGVGLKNLRLKIFLREDLWRNVRFENKSHLFGRSVMLQWREQDVFLKVALRQALNFPSFRRLIEQASLGPVSPGAKIERWSESETFEAWALLVGERMKGGKTTFTRNWVWKRLADGNGDHSPRYLLQLLYHVTEWEKRKHAQDPYDSSIIRPRAMEKCLPLVSKEALDALQEEFTELSPLLERLRNDVDVTPFSAADVRQVEDLTPLAREVGLLSVYEGAEDNVSRYTVPEIYRHALGMGRKGPV